jgi:hypothetical protein
VLLPQTTVSAFETDQYNLPPKPLADIGDEVSEHVEAKLRKAVDKINAEILRRQKCVASGSSAQEQGCDSVAEDRAKLNYLRTNDAVAHEAYKQLGAGVPPFTSMGTWMDSHDFKHAPARYQTSYWKSIFLFLPPIYLTISPTVKLFASEFGTDKIAHFFQQGYTYYKIRRRALAKGTTPEEATKKAVRWGQMSERTFYGTLVSGVYSNGDLVANYAGMKFYQGLTSESRVGDHARPATLVLKEGLWTFNEAANLPESLLKPLITDHLNEALNPSIFTEFLGLRGWVHQTVKRRSCKQWFDRYPDLSQNDLNERSRCLRLWYGEDYGFADSDRFVTIANTCFDNEQAGESDH